MIDDQPAVDGCVAGDVVAAATNRKRKSVRPRVSDRERDVLRICRADDDGRSPVDAAVEDAASGLIARIALADCMAFQARDGSNWFGRVAPPTELGALCGGLFLGFVMFSTASGRSAA